MSLDGSLLVVAILAAIISILRAEVVASALLVAASILFLNSVFILNPSWHELRLWLYTIIIKDLIMISLFGFMRGRHSFIIMLTFVATCVFHQIILAQAITGKVDNLTLLDVRPDFMKFIVICQLSTVYHAIITGDSDDGGGLAKRNKFVLHSRVGNLFYQQAFKAKR